MSWDSLTLTQKSNLMNTFIQNGISDIQTMRDTYNRLSNPNNTIPQAPSIQSTTLSSTNNSINSSTSSTPPTYDDYIQLTPAEEVWFNINQPIESSIRYKSGGKIYIKPSNRGKFTDSAKRAGMSVQEYARHILANKDKYSSTLVKRANFARNASKWKHQEGGILFTEYLINNT